MDNTIFLNTTQNVMRVFNSQNFKYVIFSAVICHMFEKIVNSNYHFNVNVDCEEQTFVIDMKPNVI